MEHQETQDLLGALALGAVSTEEWRRAQAHLDVCPDCRAAAGRLLQAVNLLPLAAREMTPPPALRSRILAAISDTETQRIPAPSVAAPRPPVRVPVFSWYRFFPQIAMAVTAILLLALAGWSNSIRNRLDQTESELSQARAQLAGFSGNIFTTSLVSRNGTPSTRGNLVYMNQEKAGMVMVRNLPQPPTGMVYQAWAQINGQIRNLGALTLYPDGTGLIYLPADIAHMSTVMITLEREPLSPSPTPTGEILLEARIQ